MQHLNYFNSENIARWLSYWISKYMFNKKVLLWETARDVPPAASPVQAYPARGRELLHPWLGGTPSLARGVPHPNLAGGRYPILGYPLPGTGGNPPCKGPGTSHWGTPWKGHGINGSIMGWRWGTPQKVHGTSGSIREWRWGTPLPPGVNRLKTLPSIILRTRAVTRKSYCVNARDIPCTA